MLTDVSSPIQGQSAKTGRGECFGETNTGSQEKWRKQEYVPNNEQDESPETGLNERKISDLPGREFRIMIIKMLTKVTRTMH